MSAPVAVLTSTSRRHRARWKVAKCWATPPPQEMPSTSTASYPSAVSIREISLHSPVKRYGAAGRGEPPTPGTSKRTTPRDGLSASTNGCSRSRLAPMPLISSSGTRSGCPWRTATRSCWSPTLMPRIVSVPVDGIRSPVENVGAWRRVQRREFLAAQAARALLQAAAALGQPGRVVRPPASFLRNGLRQPVTWQCRVAGRGPEGRFGVGRRVDHGSDVPARGQDEPDGAAEQLCAAVARLPRADMVGDARCDVAVGVDLGEIDRETV